VRARPPERALAQVRAQQAAHTMRLEEPRDPEPGGTHTDLADRAVLETPAHAAHCSQQRREYHDGRAVLIVVQHRPVEAPDQLRLDLEALGSGDVLELDCAK